MIPKGLLAVISACCAVAIAVSVFDSAKTGDADRRLAQLLKQGQEAYSRDDFMTAKYRLTAAVRLAEDEFGTSNPRYRAARQRLSSVNSSERVYGQPSKLHVAVLRASSDWRQKQGISQTIWLDAATFKRLMHDSTMEPEAVYEYVREGIEKKNDPFDPQLAPVLTSLGQIDQLRGRYYQAQGKFSRVLSIAQSTAGPESATAARARMELGNFYSCWARNPDPAEPPPPNAKAESTANYRSAADLYTALGPPFAERAFEARRLAEGTVCVCLPDLYRGQQAETGKR